MKKRIVAIRPVKNAVFTYRMTRPLSPLGASFRKTLLRKNEKIRIGDLANRLKKQGQIWVTKYIQHRHTADVLVTMRDHVNAKLVVDIDDNIWQIPFGNVARGSDKEFVENSITMTGLVISADWVTVSTDPLRNALLPLNEKIVVLPNLIDTKNWVFKRKKHDTVRIGWVWSPTHIPDLIEVESALEAIKKKYGDRVEIVVLGTEKSPFLFDVTTVKGVPFKDYPKMLTEASLDISICPLVDNDFNRCKSNIKWMESTMAGAAVVASDVYPYATSILHGKTGFLARTKDQWIRHLSNLIEHPEKRDAFVAGSKKTILERYDVENDTKWSDFYEKL